MQTAQISESLHDSLATTSLIPESLYQPLDVSQNQIRLLTINVPCSGPIKYDLIVVNLAKAPKYKALSYEWGPEHDLPIIQISGQDVKIRSNLYSFLQTYTCKPADSPEPLWIDQVCIDQESISERNHQVTLMRDIYPKACETLIWLGTDLDDGLAVQGMRQILEEAAVAAQTWSDDWDYDDAPKPWGHSLKHQQSKAIGRFQSLSYWTRHWVAQEVILSANRVLLYGKELMRWDEFKAAFNLQSQFPARVQHMRRLVFLELSFQSEYTKKWAGGER